MHGRFLIACTLAAEVVTAETFAFVTHRAPMTTTTTTTKRSIETDKVRYHIARSQVNFRLTQILVRLMYRYATLSNPFVY